MTGSNQQPGSASDSQLREYFQILQDDPRSRVFAPLALALLERGRVPDAIQVCKLGLSRNPDFSDGHLASGRVFLAAFQHKQALDRVKHALSLSGDNLEAYLLGAEIFLSANQPKPAIDACMKALDIDPENQEAMTLLGRVNNPEAAAANLPAAPQQPPEPDKFRQTTGTAPGRRKKAQAMENPFDDLMQDLEQEGAQKIEIQEQPFTALSAGSQSGIGPADDPDDFDQPTVKSAFPNPATPKLPERPPTPAQMMLNEPSAETSAPAPTGDLGQDLLAQVPQSAPAPAPTRTEPTPLPEQPAVATAGLQLDPPTSPPPEFGDRPADSALAEVALIQQVIDDYAERYPDRSETDHIPLRVSRVSSLLSVLAMIGLLTGIVTLILYLVPKQAKRIPVAKAQIAQPDPARELPPPPEDQVIIDRPAPKAGPEEYPATKASQGADPKLPAEQAPAAAMDQAHQKEPPVEGALEAAQEQLKPAPRKNTQKAKKKKSKKRRKRKGGRTK